MLECGEKDRIGEEEIGKWSWEEEYGRLVKTVDIEVGIDWVKDKIMVEWVGLDCNNQGDRNETEKIVTCCDLIVYVR